VKNLAFYGNGEPPARLLDIWRKQTPGSKGVWGQLRGVDNFREADYVMCVDNLPPPNVFPHSKCVVLNAHPESLKGPFRDMSGYKCLAKIDAREGFGFGEWWIKYDYDTLKAMPAPTKKKRLGCIMSNADTDASHLKRRAWLERFTKNDELDFDLHGRIKPWTPQMQRYFRGVCGSWDPRGAAASGGNDHMSGKEQVYLDHKCMLEFDNVGRYYFSERVFDCMLLWAMPIYWGGQGLHEYVPHESFRYLNIDGGGEDVLSVVRSDFYETHLSDLARAREALLDELQLWPRTHKLIFGTCR
jgi:hypothetical protein